MNQQRILIFLQALTKLAVVLAPFIWEQKSLPFDELPASTISWLGVIAIWVGVAVCYWAMRHMGKSFTIWPAPKPEGELVTSGPFRYTRNPIYFSVLVMGAGWAMYLESWTSSIFLLPLVMVLVVKIKLEEKHLTHQFGASYQTYHSQTNALIPWPRTITRLF